MTIKTVVTPANIGSGLKIAGSKVVLDLGSGLSFSGNQVVALAGAEAEVVRSLVALSGVAPVDADLGYDAATGKLYYRDSAGNWQPTAPALITVNYWNTVTAPASKSSATVTLPVNSPSRRAYGASWLGDGELWGYGQEANGTAGGTNGSLEHNRRPTAIPHSQYTYDGALVTRVPNFVRLWVQRYGVLLLDDVGKLWYRGWNNGRQSGITNAAAGEIFELPTLIDYFETNNITIVDAWISDGDLGGQDMYASVYAIDSAGALYVWGRNAQGQLGLGNTTDTATPTKITTLPTTVARVFVSTTYSANMRAAALLSDGKLYVAGSQVYGELGLGNATQQNSWVLSRVGVAAVDMAYQATFVIDATTGKVWCAGYNGTGWFGRGNTTSSNTWVQATSFTGVANTVKLSQYNREQAMIIDSGGNLWVAGDNIFSQLGLGASNATNQNNFVQLSAAQAPFQTKVKEVHLAGENGATSYVVTTDGQLWSCGYNAYGQRGLGNRDDSAAYRAKWQRVGVKDNVIAARVFGYDDSCTIVALDDKGKLRTCGYDSQMLNPLGNWSSGLVSIN